MKAFKDYQSKYTLRTKGRNGEALSPGGLGTGDEVPRKKGKNVTTNAWGRARPAGERMIH